MSELTVDDLELTTLIAIALGGILSTIITVWGLIGLWGHHKEGLYLCLIGTVMQISISLYANYKLKKLALVSGLKIAAKIFAGNGVVIGFFAISVFF